MVCQLPGFLRGLCCVGNYALVGLSQIREQHIFGNLPVQQRHAQLLCGVAVIRSPERHSGRPAGIPQRLPGTLQPPVLPYQRHNLLNLTKPETHQTIPPRLCLLAAPIRPNPPRSRSLG
ncbi:MAG: DUF4915 domain-containing protein [Elainella sp.]